MATDIERLAISIEANTRSYEAAMKRVERTTNAAFKGGQSNVVKLNTSINQATASASRLDNALSKVGTASGRARAFGGGFLGGFLGSLTNPQAIIQGVTEIVKKADQLVDAADRLGTSATNIRAFQNAIQQLGGEADDAVPALEFLFRLIGKAESGNQAAIGALRQVGIAVKDLAGVDFGQQINVIATAIGRLEGEEAKIAATVALFGRGATSLAGPLGQGAKAIERLRDEAEKLNDVDFEETERKLADYADSWEDATRDIEAEIHKQVALFLEGKERIERGFAAATAVDLAVIAGPGATEKMGEIIGLIQVYQAEINKAAEALARGKELAANGLVPPDAIDENIARIKQLSDEIKKLRVELEELQPDIFNQWAEGLDAFLVNVDKATRGIQGIGRALLQSGEQARTSGPTQRRAEDVSMGRLGRDDADFLKTKAVSGRIAERIEELNADFIAAAAELLRAFPDLKITSAARTFAEQAELRRKFLAGEMGPAAPPGRSLHEKGLAIDITINDLSDEEKEKIRRMAEELGLEFPASLRTNDPGHLQSALPGLDERMEERGTSAATAFDEEAEAIRARVEAGKELLESINQETTGVVFETNALTLSEQEAERARAAFVALAEAKRLGQEIGIQFTTLEELEAAKNLTPELERWRQAILALADAKGLLIERNDQVALSEDQLLVARDAAIDRMDAFRSAASDVLGGFISDLRAGKSGAEALGNALDSIADKLIDMALNQLITGLFGGMGTGGGGLFGGLLGGIFGGGAPAVVPGVVGAVAGGLGAGLKTPSILPAGISVPSISRSAAMGGAGRMDRVHVVFEEGPMLRPVIVRTSAGVSAEITKRNNRQVPGMLASNNARGI